MNSVYKIALGILCSANINVITAQSFDTIKFEKQKNKVKMYALWGYTRAKYSKSTIRLQDKSGKFHEETGRNHYYDFKVHDVSAKDRPDFDQIEDVANITIPQFVARIGFEINNKWDFEINYDHTKYIVTDFQKVRTSGQINNQWFDNDTILDPATFLHFEHSDGANFLMFNAVRKFNIWQPVKNFKLSAVLKPGGGVVLPRTEVVLFGERLNNDWKIAGMIFGAEAGIRINFLKYGLFEFTTKGSWANYINSFVLGAGGGKAQHHFFAGQLTATIGMQFGN